MRDFVAQFVGPYGQFVSVLDFGDILVHVLDHGSIKMILVVCRIFSKKQISNMS